MRPGAAEAFLTLLRTEAIVITPTIDVTLCRDPKDDMPLKVAATGRADYLVSADRDLIDDSHLKATMKAQYDVKVVTVSEFLAALEATTTSNMPHPLSR